MSSEKLPSDASGLSPALLPRHLAVIMDGNGRWAKKRLMNRVKGHEKGAETVRMVVRTCRELTIPYLTLYAFSTENWQRPKMEVAALMNLLKRFLVGERGDMLKNGIRLNAIGELDRLPDAVRNELDTSMDLTRNNTAMTLTLALSYGSRTELVNAVQRISEQVAEGSLSVDEISETRISDHLYTRELPDPDLMIRTSGEIRVSNFLLWQLAYAEFCFTDTLWPDFTREELIGIIAEFQNRERRFGQVES